MSVSMSAVWLKLITVLCVSCTALSGSESSGVEWRDFGGTITIQCRPPKPDQDMLTFKGGLGEDDIFVKRKNSDKITISKEFKDRLQLNGAFPNVDILIKNLSSNDTGPFWCSYSKVDPSSSRITISRGPGSVLLVVADGVKKCEEAKRDLVLISVVISSAVLLGIIMAFLIWIILKTKTLRTTVKPRRVPTNEVYEDMRGTLRR